MNNETTQNLNQPLTPRFVNRKVSQLSEAPVAEFIEQKLPEKPKDEIFIPTKVILKPYSPGNFRLGLEKTKEGFMRLPGTGYRWEPSRKGNTYQTGLQYISKQKREELQVELGKELNSEFYAEMTYTMDGSNPHGHHMDLTKAWEMIVYLAMLDSHLIANNKLEKTNGKRPEADWFIEDLEAEAEIESKESDKFIEVTKLFAELSDQKKMHFAKIMKISVRGLSPKVASNLLWKKIADNKALDYQKTLDKFIQMNKWSDEKINILGELEDAIAYNVIRRNAAGDYVYGDEVLGSTLEQVQSKLLQGDGGLRSVIKSKLALRG